MMVAKNKYIVIMRASAGIGKAGVLYLDKLQARVFVGVHKEAYIQMLQSLVSPPMAPIFINVMDECVIKPAIENVAETVGASGLVGLVNNVGTLVSGSLEFLPIFKLRR